MCLHLDFWLSKFIDEVSVYTLRLAMLILLNWEQAELGLYLARIWLYEMFTAHS